MHEFVERIGELPACDGDVLVAALDRLERTRRSLDAVRLELVGELDARGETLRRSGLRTNAWLGHTLGSSRPRAARDVAVARKLRTTLPRVADALAEGRISEEHAALLSRLCTPRVESVLVAVQDELIDLAAGVRYERWARDVRALVDHADADGGHQPLPERSHLRLSEQPDGTVHLQGTFVGADAATIAHHLRQAGDAAFRRRTRDELITEGTGGGGHGECLAQGLVDLIRSGGAAGSPSAPAADVTVSVPVDHPALVGRPGGAGTLDHHGHLVTPDALDLLTCDATITAVVVDSLGTPLDLGSTVRFVDRTRRRALAARDGGCVFPGCDAPHAWTDAHHVVRFADGGRTDLENLASLCRHHHGVVHQSGWSMQHVGHQHFQVTTPRGVTLDCQRHHRPVRPPGPSSAPAHPTGRRATPPDPSP